MIVHNKTKKVQYLLQSMSAQKSIYKTKEELLQMILTLYPFVACRKMVHADINVFSSQEFSESTLDENEVILHCFHIKCILNLNAF